MKSTALLIAASLTGSYASIYDDYPDLAAVGGLKVRNMDAGGNFNCAISGETGPEKLQCWGAGGAWLGLGDGHNRGDHPMEMGDYLPEVQLGSSGTPVQVATGKRHTCVLLSTNEVKCFGRAARGAIGTGEPRQIGDDLSEMGENLKSVNLGSEIGQIKQIVAGGYHTCALFADSKVKCWGDNKHGQLGYGDSVRRGRRRFQMGDALPFVDLGSNASGIEYLAAGMLHTCALFGDGKTKCWGANRWGQLGVLDKRDRGTRPSDMGDNLPYTLMLESVFVGGNPSIVVSITAGKYHTCAVVNSIYIHDEAAIEGEVYCWGFNSNGELGNYAGFQSLGGAPLDYLAFEAISGVSLPFYTSPSHPFISAGDHHTCALLANEQITCWGKNNHGQLGIGDTKNRGLDTFEMFEFLPSVNLPNDTLGILDIKCGDDHCCAGLLFSEDVTGPYCWGRNHQGQLGLGDKETRGDEPSEIPAGRQFKIDLLFEDPDLDPAMKQVFEKAAQKWSSILTSDYIDLDVEAENFDELCPVFDIPLGMPYIHIDDIVMGVSVREIDGPGNILGQAGPCVLFPEDLYFNKMMPRVGFMVFDIQDLQLMNDENILQEVITHEMGHVLGIGTLWQIDFPSIDFSQQLIDDAESDDPRYNGKYGKFGLKRVGGNGKPKVEGDGGPGTRLGHWDEETYEGELMTGYVEAGGVEMPVSSLTVESLRDLGNSVNSKAAEPYSLPSSGRRLRARYSVGNDIADIPIKVVTDFTKVHSPIRRSDGTSVPKSLWNTRHKNP